MQLHVEQDLKQGTGIVARGTGLRRLWGARGARTRKAVLCSTPVLRARVCVCCITIRAVGKP